MASASLLFSTILLLFIASASSTTNFGNVLNAGDRLKAGDKLAINNYKFTMQSDCNVVLYDNDEAKWDSNTQGMGTNCYMVLQSNGELFIFAGSGAAVWRSQTGGAYGKYTLVLHPNGSVVVYGNPIWSTGTVIQSTTRNVKAGDDEEGGQTRPNTPVNS